MKKFQFQFESVLKMRRHKRSMCRQLLGEMLQTDQRLIDQAEQLKQHRSEQFQEIRVRQSEGRVDIDGTTSLRYYAGQLQTQIKSVNTNRELMGKQIVLCRQALAKAEQEVKAMEKLSDKHREIFLYAQNQKEMVELEETWSATQQTGGYQ